MKHLTEDLKFLNKNFEHLCTECNGLGHIADEECPTCEATGYKIHNKAKNNTDELYENIYSRYSYDRNNPDLELCDECVGMGHTNEIECSSCNATGLVLKSTPKLKQHQATIARPQSYRIKDQMFTLCSTCEGQGHIDDVECYNCGSTGLKRRATMKYNLDQYTELYRKYISFENNQPLVRERIKMVPVKENETSSVG